MHKVVPKSLFICALILIALNLRAPFTSVFPLLDDLKLRLDMSSQQAGLLSSIPLLAFAIFSPIAAIIAKKISLETTISLGLLTIIAGLCLRAWIRIDHLLIGTALIGVGIAIINVLLPSVIKQYFPNITSPLTALYILMMGIGAAINSSIVVPLSSIHFSSITLSGLPIALLAMLPVCLFALLVWLPIQLKRTLINNSEYAQQTPPIWKRPLAWKITVFFGLNSSFNYIFISWYPAMLTSVGYSVETAGLYHGVLQLASAIPALVMAPLMLRYQSMTAYCVFALVTAILGIVGLLFFPPLALWSGILFGMGAGCGFTLGLSFITLKTSTPFQAVALSGMAQSIGYFLASFAPFLAGYLHETSHQWNSTLIAMLAITPIWATCGLLICKSQRI
ncbi:MFS transporter [Parashewanella spongiae]|uniref:MFS transporter n=1 Tax=Parashewanella spongiae TaxID=342950 RepID=A0A3A6TC92_9GAMM|nr:MFS transporter [Parashewanella spongiae]MCL1079104.1 MFS transporter [Parashewanella spongiae]RJY07415.1 MFS transporter [Parashewanella spongiae]